MKIIMDDIKDSYEIHISKLELIEALALLSKKDIENNLYHQVKHGHWIKNGCRYCECSVCHQEGNITGADNYCLHCGAKMDEV